MVRLRSPERHVPHLRHQQRPGRPLESLRRSGQGRRGHGGRIVDQDASGITIRGAKLFATSAIMANEIFISSRQPLKPGEEHLAFSCALPMATKGINLLSRKSFEASAVSEFDNPLSTRFDENDALSSSTM
ncbi:MAG: 4-hydroxyphenylacetate 3-hydroxylase N-terminal domain-containing protein [Bradyrhizobium sp.]